ncbi:MAG: UDP-N-acetylenolpyruvoylglucosamine reductase [Chloroflexi bacterium HGW-Chloroflexi-8]|nr:MAG: UDP-N-acetylenolpyruvoylglucosamine reductase [Chloroflexi bacterium HGW-Chloroflexi-8]
MMLISHEAIEILKEKFGKKCQLNLALAPFTTAQVGGPAKVLITVNNRESLIDAIKFCWENDLPYKILGSGSNVLVHEDGFNGVVILNRSKNIVCNIDKNPPEIYVESGANLSLVARKAALVGIAGLEWAATIPGTIGGAIYGNAGAHQSDMSHNLILVEILQQLSEPVYWNVEQMEYSYRCSVLKRKPQKAVILSAILKGFRDNPEEIQKRTKTFINYRKKTQPTGASMGSMFKNPPGDFAGRLIESAGLKGTSVGGVTVSSIHANFFLNSERATSNDYLKLIQLVQKTVYEKFEVNLDLEIELVGFPEQSSQNFQSGTIRL